ncbi:hypothetical protein J2W79_004419 [Methylorubrum extorquens]|nr:hypothetical protein [Methylorubrum extorquens]
MQRLEALIIKMDVCLNGSIQSLPTGGAFVEVACRDAATASALLESWLHEPIDIVLHKAE